MQKLKIVCVDDQREVLAALRKDLAQLQEACDIIDCESADEVIEVLDEIEAEDGQAALIISDHVMPGKSGVELLIEVRQDGRFPNTRKLLLTGMATHQDTINAINNANIDNYIEKPWTEDNLLKTTKILLTKYVFDSGLDYNSYMKVLDQDTLYQYLRQPG
jgi:two-component system chemotaxis response regulator CheY